MFCSKCGAANVDDAVVCKSCATAITLALTSGNRLIAAGLSLVVPGLGQAFLGRAGALRLFVKTLLGYLLIIPRLILHAMCVIDENFDSASRLRRNLIAILDVAECSGRALIPSWQLTSKVVGEIAGHNVLMAAI